MSVYNEELIQEETRVSDNVTFSVKPVVCDYGIYENDKLLAILSSRFNAFLIKAILVKDAKSNGGFDMSSKFQKDDFMRLKEALRQHTKDGEDNKERFHAR